MPSTRRDLIKLAGGAALAQTGLLPSQSAADSHTPISIWTTAGEGRFASRPPLSWRAARDASIDAVVLDPSRKFQEILGFGAAFTDASCYLINTLSQTTRAALLEELLHPSKLGLNVFRICIGSSDYATGAYSFDEGSPDPEMARFSIERDRDYLLPVLKQARAVNPGLFLLASPWSPPGWMKANGSMLGGSMRKHNFAAYAKYFVKFLQAYEAAGVPVQAVTIQNEVDTDQDGRMPACLWGQEYETEFVARHLGPQFAANKIDTRIWIVDHNYNLWGRAIASLDEPAVNRYVDGVAWHGYLGRPTAMSRVKEAHPEKHMYWTEGGPDVRDPRYLTNWSRWGSTFAAILENWARCIIGWNIVLDEKGKPNIGPFECAGALTIHSQTKEITRSGLYWALAHYSQLLRRGAYRIESTSASKDLSHVAAVNPDGSFAVVLTNPGAERRLALRLAGMEAEVPLPADSITSLRWTSL